MTQQDEWSDWIRHDGKGCPCRGHWVDTHWSDNEFLEGVAGSNSGDGWDWQKEPLLHVIRYRIRKPRGMAILEALLQDMPQDVDA
jgi:hypothetical protein